MTHAQAFQLAVQLMERHGLLEAGWRFRWSRGKRQQGLCEIKRRRHPVTGEEIEIKTIKLSAYLVALNSDEEVRDTILHEIAHALAGIENGHNEKWKAICRRIGAKPERTAGEEVKVAAAPYAIVCGCCRETVAQRHRRMRRERLERLYCRQCGTQSLGKLQMVVAGR